MMKLRPEIHIRQNIYFQLFFWIALFVFGIARTYGEYDGIIIRELVIYNFCHWIFQIIGANFIYYILIRYFFDRRKYVTFSIGLIISLYMISVINRIFIVYLAEPFSQTCLKIVSSVFSRISDTFYSIILFQSSVGHLYSFQ